MLGIYSRSTVVQKQYITKEATHLSDKTINMDVNARKVHVIGESTMICADKENVRNQ